MQTTIDTRFGAITIRPTCAEDAAAFRELRLEALREHPEAFGADYTDQAARPIETWEESVRRGAGNDLGITYVAVAGQTLAGMVGIFRGDYVKMQHSGTIWGVYVRPAWRGAGLADALIAACLNWARGMRMRLVRLNVVTTNAAAIRCYIRCGFSVCGVEPEVVHVNGTYYDELSMIHRL